MPPTATTAFLILDVAGTACALARTCVSEVLPLPRLHRRSATAGMLAGFLNLGGAAVPVIDLARLLGLSEAAADPDDVDRHLVLDAARSTAFLVDRAEALVVVPDSEIQPADETRSLNGCVVAGFERGRGHVDVLSLARLLTQEERVRLDALTRAAAERLSGLDAATAP
ncbi:chemotaxis protein CheW [Methylobacterium sp. E-045]|uniref:chemotaxis protein CheW n=1 Tax=Methylobacterium sp. E-045 TaxID=2836575 RepID=UPI001FBA7924|nr:chemotaxis protein CheW [Methylobacterium sp. E-045]MCJ2130497.1 chemotaxis protein CheW [Methylobacterium sp. E-045]